MRVSSLKELEKELQKRINNALNSEVADVVKYKMEDHIISDVYNVYDPEVYVRRYTNGGLIDPNNIVAYAEHGTLTVKNITIGDKYVSINHYTATGHTSTPTVSQNYNKPIAGVIETGKGYDVHGWQYDGVPRPFMKNTRDELEQSHLHTKVLKQGLIRQGLNVK